METAVQIFSVKEAEELSVSEVTEQWKSLVDDLQLEGQKRLLMRDDEDEALSPVPYVFLNYRMTEVLKTLCPKQDDISDYGKMPIPMEILGHVKLCELNKFFKRIEVWSDDKEPDPVVVGVRANPGKTDDLYLIGRWGAEAQTFEQLEKRAVKRMAEQKKIAVAAKISELQATIEGDNLIINIQKILNGDYTPLKYV